MKARGVRLTYLDWREGVRQALLYLLLFAVAFVMCFPLIWSLSTSLKPAAEISVVPSTLVPEDPTLRHYEALLLGRQMYYRAETGYQPETAPSQHFVAWFRNSVLASAGAMLVSIVIATMAAYSLTRFRFAGRAAIPYLSLLGYMMPPIVMVFPLFLLIADLGLADTLWSMVIGYVAITLPFSTWLMWAFFRSLPIEIEEAALIDGASRIQVFAHIVLPSALPGIIAAAIFCLIVSWNDYLFGRIFLNAIDNLTLPVGVMHFFEGVHVDWGLMMAASVLITLPLAILFMLFQRQLVAGFGAGALKG